MRAARWWSDRLGYVLGLFGGAVLAVWQLPDPATQTVGVPLQPILAGLGVVLLVAGSFIQLTQVSRVSAMQAALDEARDEIAKLEDRSSVLVGVLTELLEAQLRILAQTLFGPCHDHRVSLFTHDGKGHFTLIARWSENPAFAAPGRGVYPDDQGCLGIAWQSGRTATPLLPDPQANRQQWITAQSDRCQVPKKVSQALRMKSREYRAYRLNDHRSRPTGVIVFETVGSEPLPGRELDERMENEEGRRLSHFLEMMTAVQPELPFARERGF